MQPFKKEPENDTVPTYELFAINHAYNEGKLTVKEWLELSREWALKVIEQYDREAAAKRSPRITPRLDSLW